MLNLKRNTLSVALASALLALATGARAESSDQAAAAPDQASSSNDQTDASTAEKKKEARKEEATELESITVSGIRRGIETAIEVKADSDQIIEVVAAEDLGKLPDISIAESIARLPGLAAQRVAGRSSTISIRGFSGDYGTTLLNGREQVSVGDNRTVEFDQYPSELINSVVVYKTPDASLVGQGLSGTVDLRTVRPLSFPERVVSFNVRGEKNSYGKINEEVNDYGSRLSAFYLDQFMDHTLGIALGYARLDSPGERRSWESWGYPNYLGPDPGDYTLGGEKIQAGSTNNTRQGAIAVLEYRPGGIWSSTLDVFYSKFDKSEYTRFLETGLGWGGGVTQINPVVRNGVVVESDFVGVRPVLRNDLNEGNDKLFSIGWNNEFQFNDEWNGKIDLSHSKADRDESIQEQYSGTRAGVLDTVHVVVDPNGPAHSTFGIDYTDPTRIVLTDPGGWGQEGYIKFPQITDKLDSYRFDVERTFLNGVISSFQFGANYSDREKTRRVPEFFLDLQSGTEQLVDPQYILDPVREGNGLPGTLTYRINDVLHQYLQERENVNNSDIINKQWTVDEKVTTVYAQLNFQGGADWIPVRGNIGISAVHADQNSDGFSVIKQGGAFTDVVPFSGGTNYTDYLPNLNLAFSFPEGITGRLALGKQVARPRIDQMRANNNTDLTTSGQDIGIWKRSGGNPELQPWTANALDLSFEKYWDNKAYVSVAYYYKDLTTFVFDQQTTFDASGLAPPPGYTGPPPSPVGQYTRPANGSGGKVDGFEIAVSVPLDLFSPVLEGFGIVGNFSDTDSSITLPNPDGTHQTVQLPGLSRQIRNFSAYYENYGFQARVSARSRSSFLGEIQGFGADRSLVYIDGETVVDAQVGYSFNDGMFKGTTLLLQVNNLTDEPYRQFYNDSKLTQYYAKYGRQYLLGITYKF